MISHGLRKLSTNIFAENGELRVQKLATIAVRTETGFVELNASFGLKIRWDMLLLDKLMTTVCERTGVLEDTGSCKLPISTHLSLEFSLILFDKVVPVPLTSEHLLWALDRGHILVGSSGITLLRGCRTEAGASCRRLVLEFVGRLSLIRTSLVKASSSVRFNPVR